jgi:hypothetical protein
MHPKKVENVLAMDSDDRFSYFVRKVADSQKAWGLFNEGWATAADDDGRQAIPFWPEAEFAASCATGEWSSFRPKDIDLGVLLERWLPGMSKDGSRVAVFPTPANRGVLTEPEDLCDALKKEAAQYE